MLRAIDVLKGPHGGRLYETLFFEAKIKFQYPPTSLVPLELLGILIPTSILALNALNTTALFLNAALLGVLAYWLISVPPSSAAPLMRLRWLAPCLAFAAGIFFYPTIRALVAGQTQLWLDLAFTLAILLWLAQRQFGVGLVLGFAAAIKPQYGLFIVWALLGRQWNFLAGFVAMLLPIGLVSVWRYGLHNHFAYLEVLSYISKHGEAHSANNSVNGIVNRLLMNGPVFDFDPNAFAPYNVYVHAATMAAAIVFTAVGLVPVLQRGPSGPGPLHLGVAALCFTMASPVAWEHHYGLMLPLYIVALHGIFADQSQQFRRYALVMLCISWFLSVALWPGLAAVSGSPWNLTHAHLFFGAVVLLVVLIQLTRRETATAHRGEAATV